MNFKSWTIGKKLWFLAITSTILLLTVEVFNISSTKRLTASMLGSSQLPAVRAMTLADMMHDALRAVVYRSIIAAHSKNKDELTDAKSEYEEFAKNIHEHLGVIKQSSVSDSVKAETETTVEEVEVYLKSGQVILKLAEENRVEDAIQHLPTYQKSFKDLEEKMEKLGDHLETEVQAAVEESRKLGERMETTGMLVAVLGSLFGLFLSVWINRDLVKILKNMVTGLNAQGTAIKEHSDGIDISSKNLSAASTQQASAIQETAAAIEEINSMVGKTASNSSRLAESSKSSYDVAEEGRVAIQRMLTEMEAIKVSNGEVMKQIEKGNDQIKSIVQVIGEIGEKTKVINDIVFQTKLLSFNASVEAARAGEHGKGFAVVAEEVGNLAQLSGTAAKDISQMLESGMNRVSEIVDANRASISQLIEQSSRKIDHGKEVADQCGTVFSKIVTQVSEVSQLSTEISSAIQEQRTGLNEIGRAIGLFSESMQVNSTTAHNTSEVSKNLQESFQELNLLMGELKSLVNGNDSADNGQETHRAA